MITIFLGLSWGLQSTEYKNLVKLKNFYETRLSLIVCKCILKFLYN